jgi:hypothetical protein
MDLLSSAARHADEAGKPDVAAQKRRLSSELLSRYQEVVANCESPRFAREAERLATLPTMLAAQG